MCYFLYVASPLTLSEVRSMLPAGLAADALPVSEQQHLKDIHYDAAIGARQVAHVRWGRGWTGLLLG